MWSIKYGLAALALLLQIALTDGAAAQSQSSRSTTIVLGFAAGGFLDTVARVVGQRLSERLGQPVVVENRPGAGGNIAHRLAAGSVPDGHVILASSTALAINETLYKNRGYSASDFRPLSISVSTPEILLNHPSGPKTLKDVLDGTKTKPVNFGTGGAGTASYVVTEYFFKELAKAPATHIPFQGGAPMLNAALANHIDLAAAAMAGGFVPHIGAGTLRGLAIASEKRHPLVPSVPTYAESGYPNFVALSWAGFFVPAKTPEKIIVQLNAAINDILKEPDVSSRMKTAGYDPIIADSVQADAMFRSEIEKWRKMIDAIGLRID